MGEKIYNLRKKFGFSQEDLADKLGVSRQSISLWETDQAMPSLDNLIKLSEIFNVSLDELCKESTNKENLENSEDLSEENPVLTTCITKLELKHVKTATFYYDMPAIIIYLISLAFLTIWIIFDLFIFKNYSRIFICGILIMGIVIGSTVRRKILINKSYNAKDNYISEVKFYKDKIVINSTTISNTSANTIKYDLIKKVVKKQDHIIVFLKNNNIIALSLDRVSNIDALFNILKVKPDKQNSRKKPFFIVSIVLFIFTILSVPIIFIISVFINELSAIPEVYAIVEYFWISLLFLPISIGSLIYGIVCGAKKILKCKKNIISGIIVTVLLFMFGIFAFALPVSHDYKYVLQIEATTSLDFPNDGYLTRETSSAYTYVRFYEQDKESFVNYISTSDLWKEDNDFIPSLIKNSYNYILDEEFDYCCLFNKNTSEFNYLNVNSTEKNEYYYFTYNIKNNLCVIYEFTV